MQALMWKPQKLLYLLQISSELHENWCLEVFFNEESEFDISFSKFSKSKMAALKGHTGTKKPPKSVASQPNCTKFGIPGYFSTRNSNVTSVFRNSQNPRWRRLGLWKPRNSRNPSPCINQIAQYLVPWGIIQRGTRIWYLSVFRNPQIQDGGGYKNTK